MKQQRRLSDVEDAMDAPNNNIVVTARMAGVHIAFKVGDAPRHQGHTAPAFMNINALELISARLRKLHRQSLLIGRQDIYGKGIAGREKRKTGGGVRDAP